MSNYPSTITAFTNPNPTDRLNNPSHSSIETAQNTGLTEIQTFLGTTISSAVGTIIYDIRSPDSNGGGHVQGATKGGTGQTTFNKGDIFVATNSSTISKLAVGADGLGIIADSTQAAGLRYGTPGVNVQSFLSGGTWTRPASFSQSSRTFVELWGGGGSGGTSGGSGSAGGGGGGAYNAGWFFTSILGGTETVTIGSGGASVAGTNQTGNPGGITVFGTTTSILSAFGGGGGAAVSGNGTGGGGGGQLGAGLPSVNNTGGVAGKPGTPISGTGGTFGSVVGSGLYSGGGAAGGTTSSILTGGDTVYGGAGGGGCISSISGVGGISNFGGNGGNGNGAGAGVAGSVPGGGGGGGHHSSLSGPGANGKAVITTIG